MNRQFFGATMSLLKKNFKKLNGSLKNPVVSILVSINPVKVSILVSINRHTW